MSEANFSRVDSILDAVRDGLSSFVLKQYKQKHNGKEYLRELHIVLTRHTSGNYSFFENEDQALKAVDALGWLKAVWHQKPTFYHKLGIADHIADSNARNGFNYVSELLNVRRRPAHRAPINELSDEEVYRVSDTATLLLQAIKAKNEAAATEKIKLEFGRKIYIAETGELESAGEDKDFEQSEEQTPESLAGDDNEDIDFRVDLSGLNLSASIGSDLRERNFHLANLEGTDLSGLILDNVRLVNLNLPNVILANSSLMWANLSGSNLRGANLSDARAWYVDLTNADLSHATMERTRLRDAKLDYVDFRHANLTAADISTSQDSIGGESSWLDMSGDNFERLYRIACFNEVNFSDAILRYAKMQRFYGNNVNLIRADLTEANLAGARIECSYFVAATLISANLTDCEIHSCDFSGAMMQAIDLSGAESTDSTFRGAKMQGANLMGFAYRYDGGDGDYSWEKADLSGADLTGAKLERMSLLGANLTGAIFNKCNLDGVDLSYSDLMDTDFTGAQLICVNFEGAKFRYTTILPDGSYWDEDTDMTKFTGSLDDC